MSSWVKEGSDHFGGRFCYSVSLIQIQTYLFLSIFSDSRQKFQLVLLGERFHDLGGSRAG